MILQRFTVNLDVFPHNNIQHYFLKYILGAVRIYGIGTNHRVYWTVPNDGSWSYLTSNPDEWIWRIVIDGDTIYGIVSDGSVYEISVHGGSWTQIAPPDIIDLAYWNGRLYGLGTGNKVSWTEPNGAWSKLSGMVYTMRTNLPKTLDQLIFCKYTLNFSLELFTHNFFCKKSTNY